MRIYVCLKQVPDTAANIRILGPVAIDEKIKYIINPYDEYALEEAVRLKSSLPEVEIIALSVGPPRVESALRAALAVGADRAIHVCHEEYFLDSFVTARLLMAALTKEGPPDLIFMGKQSIDTEGMQTHYRLAGLLGLPVVVDVVSCQWQSGGLTVLRELEGGRKQEMELPRPAVLAATRGLNQPRSPTLPEIMKARKKELQVIPAAELPVAKTRLSLITSLAATPERGRGKILCDTPDALAEELLRILKEEARVI